MVDAVVPNRVLITGAAGAVGSVLRTGLQGRYSHLRLTDIVTLGEAEAGEELVMADILDASSLDAAMADVDCVVHLAGIADEDTWDRVLSLTIDGCYKVFEAARRAGVRRIVYASSNHAIGFYRREQSLDTDVPLRPDGRYGVSNAFGEVLGRMYADKYGMSVACVRIGSFRAFPEDRRQLMTWISPGILCSFSGGALNTPITILRSCMVSRITREITGIIPRWRGLAIGHKTTRKTTPTKC